MGEPALRYTERTARGLLEPRLLQIDGVRWEDVRNLTGRVRRALCAWASGRLALVVRDARGRCVAADEVDFSSVMELPDERGRVRRKNRRTIGCTDESYWTVSALALRWGCSQREAVKRALAIAEGWCSGTLAPHPAAEQLAPRAKRASRARRAARGSR